MARNTIALEEALHKTKAAKYARAKRRRRNRRIVDASGGPIYAKDCRRKAIQRIANEATQQEAAVEARQLRAVIKRLNTWRRIYLNIRN